jgi:hypothetical protein
MIRRVVRFRGTRRIPEMLTQLGTERPLDDRLLEPADYRVELLRGQ